MTKYFDTAKQLRDWLNNWDDDELQKIPVVNGECQRIGVNYIDSPDMRVFELAKSPDIHLTEQQKATAIRLGNGDFFRGVRCALASRGIE